ncbi:hypothetical protein [Rubritalea halochordaticola]
MALGRLQEMAGRDDRVTASAEVLEKEGVTVAKGFKHVTGVWDSGQWDPTDYQDKHFKDWLVSRREKNDLAEDYVMSGPSGTPTIELVGEGSVGTEDEADKITVELEDVKDGSSKLTGRLAYVVLDEGVKAGVSTGGKVKETDVLGLSRGSIVARTALDQTSIQAFESSDEKDLENTLSLPTADLVFGLQGGADSISKKGFHDFSAGNYTLLSDVRNTGLKRDLSSAFELDLAEFNAIEEFHNSGEKNNTRDYSKFNSAEYNKPQYYGSQHSEGLGYLFEIPASAGGNRILRGPTWDLLRNHYRLYKRDRENEGRVRDTGSWDDNTYAARGVLPLSYSSSPFGAFKGNFAFRSNPGFAYSKGWAAAWENVMLQAAPRGGIGGKALYNQPTAAALAPQVTRITIILGLARQSIAQGKKRIVVTFDPYYTVHNPYNVPLEFDSLGFFISKFNMLQLQLREVGKSFENVPFSNNYYTNGSITMRMPEVSGRYRLEPGEVKTLSPLRIDQSKLEYIIDRSDVSVIHASPVYSEGSGIIVPPARDVSGDKIISTYELAVRGRSGGSEYDHFVFSMYQPKDHRGAVRDLDTNLPKGIQADGDIFDDEFMTKISLSSHNTSSGRLELIKRGISGSQIPDVGAQADRGAYMVAVDIRKKHAGDDAPVFMGFNTLTQAVDPRDYDGSARISPNWEIEFKDITTIEELQLVADGEGHGMWGAATEGVAGSSKVVLYEVPRVPMTSMAQFQHANTGIMNSSGTKHIGNSFPHVGIPDLRSIDYKRPSGGPYSKNKRQDMMDTSWAANEAIWDRYFLSGLHYGSQKLAGSLRPKYGTKDEALAAIMDESKELPFFNPYIVKFPTSKSEDKIKKELEEYDQISRNLAIKDGFNINSTSVDAWRAVLAGAYGTIVPKVNDRGTVEYDRDDKSSPTGRYAMPTDAGSDVWQQPRKLDETEIEKLAEAMVKQVKIRGPFMGLSDFVNRRITRDDVDGYAIGGMGAMQMAIEEAGLNSNVKYSRPVTNPSVEHKSTKIAGSDVALSTMTGAPQYVMQADILSLIGGRITARSDTFKIRAYGESIDQSGKVVAKAWCEAIVQRTPEWLESSDEMATKEDDDYPQRPNKNGLLNKMWTANDQLSNMNQEMGRRFKIVSFRWLSSDEV